MGKLQTNFLPRFAEEEFRRTIYVLGGYDTNMKISFFIYNKDKEIIIQCEFLIKNFGKVVN